MNNLEKIKNIIGQEGLDRVLQAMEILGVSFPDNFEIYRKAGYFDRCALSYKIGDRDLDPDNTYAVVLSQEEIDEDNVNQRELDQIGFFEFNKYYQTIVFGINGMVYSWERTNPTTEHFTISVGEKNNYKHQLSANLIGRDEGINSSTLAIEGKHEFPTIYSYIDYAEMKEHIYDGWGTDEDFIIKEPIENYNEELRRVLTEKRFQCLVPDELQKPEYYALLMRMMKDPIDRIIYEMTLTDQSWRFEKEREAAQREYESALDKASDTYKKATAEAARARKWAGHAATDKRDARLDEIAKKEAEYKAQMKLRFDEDN